MVISMGSVHRPSTTSTYSMLEPKNQSGPRYLIPTMDSIIQSLHNNKVLDATSSLRSFPVRSSNTPSTIRYSVQDMRTLPTFVEYLQSFSYLTCWTGVISLDCWFPHGYGVIAWWASMSGFSQSIVSMACCEQ